MFGPTVWVFSTSGFHRFLRRSLSVPKPAKQNVVKWQPWFYLRLFAYSFDWSGRAMARSGLRMMPTFPLPSLKFRTAGFPQYGFKAGMSDKAFPCDASLTSIGLPSSFVLPAALV